MKSLLFAIMIILLVASAMSCKKQETCRSYQCTTLYTAYGRGVEKTDTAGCLTDDEVRQYEASRYISNDTISQQTTCK